MAKKTEIGTISLNTEGLTDLVARIEAATAQIGKALAPLRFVAGVADSNTLEKDCGLYEDLDDGTCSGGECCAECAGGECCGGLDDVERIVWSENDVVRSESPFNIQIWIRDAEGVWHSNHPLQALRLSDEQIEARLSGKGVPGRVWDVLYRATGL